MYCPRFPMLLSEEKIGTGTVQWHVINKVDGWT